MLNQIYMKELADFRLRHLKNIALASIGSVLYTENTIN